MPSKVVCLLIGVTVLSRAPQIKLNDTTRMSVVPKTLIKHTSHIILYARSAFLGIFNEFCSLAANIIICMKKVL